MTNEQKKNMSDLKMYKFRLWVILVKIDFISSLINSLVYRIDCDADIENNDKY